MSADACHGTGEQRGYYYNLCLTDALGSGMSLVTLWSRRDETLDHWELVFSAARDAAPGVFDEVAPRTKWTLLSDKSKGLKGAATKQLPQVKHLNDSYHKENSCRDKYGQEGAALYKAFLYARTEAEEEVRQCPNPNLCSLGKRAGGCSTPSL